MKVDDAEQQVRTLATELRHWRSVAAKGTTEAARVEPIVRAYVRGFPELQAIVDEVLEGEPLGDDDGDEGIPKGADAVRLVMQEQPNYQFWVSELVAALKERGWLPDSDNPANAVRAAVERLMSTPGSDIRKIRASSGKVVYIYDPDFEPAEPAPAYTGGGDEEPF